MAEPDPETPTGWEDNRASDQARNGPRTERWGLLITVSILIFASLLVIGAVAIFTLGPLARRAPTATAGPTSVPTRSPAPTPTSIVHHGRLIVEAIHSGAKLETYRMTMVNDLDVTRVSGLGGLCTERIVYLGYYDVTAGVDLTNITQDDIALEGAGPMTVTITLPPAEILETTLDTQNSRLLLQETPKWIPGCETQVADMTLEAQQKIRDYVTQAALEQGILVHAQERAGFVLQQLLYKVGYPNVVIEYESPD